jgi:hypothetical protein
MATSSQADLVRPSNCGLAVYGPQVTCGRALSRALKRFLWASCGSLKRHCTIFSVQPPSAHTPPCKYIYILLTNVRGSRTLRDSILCNKGVDLEVKDRVYVALVLSSTVPLGGKPGLLFFRVAARSHASLEAATGVRNQTHRRRVLPGKHLQIEAHEAASANGGFLFSVHN